MSLDQETWVLEFFPENISVKTIAASYNWTIGMSLNFETKLDNLLQLTLSLKIRASTYNIESSSTKTISTRKILKQNDWSPLSKFSVYFFIKFGKNVCSKYLKNRRKD